jgi:hypothetical protein
MFWPTFSQSHQSNATSFGGSTTPRPWPTSRREYVQSTSPSGSGEGSGDGAPDVRLHTSGLHLHGENILPDAASRFQEIPAWQLHPFVFRAIAARWGLPMIDLFASNASKQTQRFYSWDASDNPEGVDALTQSWHFPLAYAFPPMALLKRVVKKLDVERHLHPGLSPLGSPNVAGFASDAEGVGGSLPAFHGRLSDGSDNEQAAPNPSQPSSSRLEDLWRINSLQDLPSNTRDLHKAGWRQSTEDRYDRAC